VLSIINYVFETGTQVHGDIITLINIDWWPLVLVSFPSRFVWFSLLSIHGDTLLGFVVFGTSDKGGCLSNTIHVLFDVLYLLHDGHDV
jgi:hypothetical protein